jgi:hypothetical protein
MLPLSAADISAGGDHYFDQFPRVAEGGAGHDFIGRHGVDRWSHRVSDEGEKPGAIGEIAADDQGWAI